MNQPCPFSAASLQFAGTPVQQAQCLLRRVRIGGNVDDPAAQLPTVLASNVGTAIGFTRDQLQAYLTFKGIDADDIGGALTDGVSTTPNGSKALYFVIHDTSNELVGASSFPANINDSSWSGNDLDHTNTSSAHVFINRLGMSATGHNYSVGWRATKREKQYNGALKGLFLHHELIQPRIKGVMAITPSGQSRALRPRRSSAWRFATLQRRCAEAVGLFRRFTVCWI